MYGIVEIGGHQYSVKSGDVLDVEKLESEVGSVVSFDKVLFIGGDAPKVGKPVVSGAQVTAKIIRQGKGEKVIVFKRAPGKWRRKNGHRQLFTSLLITSVKDGAGKVSEIDKASKEAQKYLK